MKSLLLPIQYYIERLLFGRRCLGCKTPGTALCAKCLLAIPAAPPCDDSRISALYSYSNPLIQKAIWDLKYHHQGSVAKILIEKASDALHDIIADVLQTAIPQHIVLVPIPQYKKKRSKRGFNHSERIAIWMTHLFPGATTLPLLVKETETIPQSHIAQKEDRFKNVDHTFSINPIYTVNPTTLYIVVDDVTTTGATCKEAFRILTNEGAVSILGIAIAHGYKHHE